MINAITKPTKFTTDDIMAHSLALLRSFLLALSDIFAADIALNTPAEAKAVNAINVDMMTPIITCFIIYSYYIIYIICRV